MKRNRFTEEKIIGILKEHEVGTPVSELCRKHGVSDARIYKWKAKFGGMEVSEAKRLKTLEDENTKLKRRAVALLVGQHRMSERRACKAIGYCRVTFHYEISRDDDQGLCECTKALAHERRRSGYRCLHVLLKREGHHVNHKKLFRL